MVGFVVEDDDLALAVAKLAQDTRDDGVGGLFERGSGFAWAEDPLCVRGDAFELLGFPRQKRVVVGDDDLCAIK
jgi:hypothetical protein